MRYRQQKVSFIAGLLSLCGGTILATDAVDVALEQLQLKKPYEWGAKGPNAFDCSGLVRYAYAHADSPVMLPPGAGQQACTVPSSQPCATTAITGPLQRGDLLFFNDDDGTDVVSHVGMYLANNIMVNAAWNGKYRADGSLDGFVVEDDITTPYWTRAFLFARRVQAPNPPIILSVFGVGPFSPAGFYPPPYLGEAEPYPGQVWLISDDFTHLFPLGSWKATATSVATLQGTSASTAVKFDQGNAAQQQTDYTVAALLATELVQQLQGLGLNDAINVATKIGSAMWGLFYPGTFDYLTQRGFTTIATSAQQFLSAAQNAVQSQHLTPASFPNVIIYTPTPDQGFGPEFIVVPTRGTCFCP